MTLVISRGITLDNGTRAAAIAGVSPTLDYRFAREKREIETVSLTDKLTYTGGNEGTLVGSDGFIQRATTNVPRFDHDPLSRRSLGLLSEVERTNLLLWSEEFDNWSKLGSPAPVVSPNAGIAPSGNFTADRLSGATNLITTASAINLRQVVTLPSVGTYVFSLYVRRVDESSTSIGIRVRDQGPGVNFGIVTVSPTDDAWYRLSSSFTATSVNLALHIGQQVGDFFIWGAQLEAASTPSTYIPTTTAAVTRTADSAVIDGTGILTGTYTMVEKPAGCAVVSGSNINLQPGFTAERVMVFPAALDAGQITAIRGAM
jgi:hypothetical protein